VQRIDKREVMRDLIERKVEYSQLVQKDEWGFSTTEGGAVQPVEEGKWPTWPKAVKMAKGFWDFLPEVPSDTDPTAIYPVTREVARAARRQVPGRLPAIERAAEVNSGAAERAAHRSDVTEPVRRRRDVEEPVARKNDGQRPARRKSDVADPVRRRNDVQRPARRKSDVADPVRRKSDEGDVGRSRQEKKESGKFLFLVFAIIVIIAVVWKA
jgi:hypothetical protein